MSGMPVAPEKPKIPKGVLPIILAAFLVLCFFALGITGFLGLSWWQIQSTRDRAATAATQTVQAFSVQATASHLARAKDRAAFEFIDPFNDNRNLWDTYEINDDYLTGGIQIENGVYVWTVDHAKQGFVHWEQIIRGPHDLTDFDVYVDAKRIKGSASGVCYGLQFRVSPIRQMNNYYAYGVCDNGYFQIEYYDGGSESWTTLSPWTHNDVILANEWNTLGVSARGDHFTFSINDWTVTQLDDARLKTGNVRLYIDVQDGESGVVWFDNLALQPR
jgi:hypothetical protein